MVLFYILLLFLVIYVLLLLLPKGFLLQEIAQLPIYWWKVKQVPLDGMTQEKHSFGTHSKQYLVLFQSTLKKDSQKPLLIYYHGGGWAFGSPEEFALNAKFFVAMGYKVVMPSYRRLPFYRNDAIAEDRILALQKTRELMQQNGWSNQKIILGGMSAGGNVAALLFYDRKSLEKINFDRSLFAGLMLHGAPLNLAAMTPTPLLYCYAGSRGSESFSRASPISYLQETEQTPILIIHGTRDGMVHYKSATTFVEKLKKLKSTSISFHPLENGNHLDAGKWGFEENHSAQLIRNWLNSLNH